MPLELSTKNISNKKVNLENIGHSILSELRNPDHTKYYRAILSAALGSIPWIGGIYNALIALQGESEQEEGSQLQKMWLLEHREKIFILDQTLKEITSRLDDFCRNEDLEKVVLTRIQSAEYLSLVRETFRAWDDASTANKREKLKKLIVNAAAIELCNDDMVRIFIKWIGQYHEYHLLIIAEVYKNPGISLGAIWDNVFNNDEERPRENSSEADLYRTLIRDLQMGGVIRQERKVNSMGEFLKKSSSKSRETTTMKSSFDNEDRMELSELGSQFIRYALEDLVPQLTDGKQK